MSKQPYFLMKIKMFTVRQCQKYTMVLMGIFSSKLGTNSYFPLEMVQINDKKTPLEKSLEFFAYYSVYLKNIIFDS